MVTFRPHRANDSNQFMALTKNKINWETSDRIYEPYNLYIFNLRLGLGC